MLTPQPQTPTVRWTTWNQAITSAGMITESGELINCAGPSCPAALLCTIFLLSCRSSQPSTLSLRTCLLRLGPADASVTSCSRQDHPASSSSALLESSLSRTKRRGKKKKKKRPSVLFCLNALAYFCFLNS